MLYLKAKKLVSIRQTIIALHSEAMIKTEFAVSRHNAKCVFLSLIKVLNVLNVNVI